MKLDEAICTEARAMIEESRRLIVQQLGQIERLVGREALRFDPAPEALAFLEGGPTPRPAAPKLVLRVAARGFDRAAVARRVEEMFGCAMRDALAGEAAIGSLGYLSTVTDPSGGRAWAFRLA